MEVDFFKRCVTSSVSRCQRMACVAEVGAISVKRQCDLLEVQILGYCVNRFLGYCAGGNGVP